MMKLGTMPFYLEFEETRGALRKLAQEGLRFSFHGTSLWKLLLTDEDGGAVAVAAHESLSFHGSRAGRDRLLLHWEDSRNLTIEVEIRLSGTLSEWRIEVANRSGLQLTEIHFPILGGIERQEAAYLALPWQWGVLVPDPVDAVSRDEFTPSEWTGLERRSHQLAAEYPGIHAMQVMAYGRKAGGVYFGIHDPEANYKRFGLYGERGCENADLILKNYPEQAVSSGTRYQLPYPVVIGLFRGGWIAAAKLYRRWATDQKWCANGVTGKRRDIPQWVKETGLWYWNWVFAREKGEPETVLPLLQRLQGRLPAPPAFHWYGWNNQGHDSDYPEYRLDAVGEKRLRDAVAAYHQAGIRVFPYLNGRLWNADTASWRSEHAGAYACASAIPRPDETGRYYIEPYMNRPFIPMCPFTKFWQQKVTANVKRVLEYGLDGAYIDQVSSSFALQCRNPAHGHGTGGSYWYHGYRTMMQQLRDTLRPDYPDAVFTSESVIECFIGSFDMFLGYQCALPAEALGNRAETIPLFTAVYHDYIPLYGTGTLLKQPEFFYGLALDITGGVMPSLQGFFAADLNSPEWNERLAMLLDWCGKYHVVRSLLADAELVELPESENKVRIKYFGMEREVPAIVASLWRCASGDQLLIAVNHTEYPQTADFELPGTISEILSGKPPALLEPSTRIILASHSVRLFHAVKTEAVRTEKYNSGSSSSL